jgi:diguanylate cyclase (GGDEF)-like protein
MRRFEQARKASAPPAASAAWQISQAASERTPRGHRSDDGQRVRLFRHLLGALASLTVVAVVYVYAALGPMPIAVAHVFAALVSFTVLTFTICFVSGFNRRFDDPSLTMAQVVASGLAMAYLAYASEPSRALQQPFYMIALMFGAFRLKTRQQVVASIYFVATYGGAIALAEKLPPMIRTPDDGAGASIGDLALVTQLALLLLLMSVIGGYVNSLRVTLRTTNNALKQALERIDRIATYDDLTALYNRRAINELAAKEQKRADRLGSSMCIAMIDADHFKRFNDLYGHPGGDDVLRMLSRVLQRTLRETEYVGRYGGEEFMVVLPETTKERATIPLERLRQAVAATPIDGLPPDVRITVSVGAADYQRGEGIATTIARADAALYEAKRLGRDRLVWSEA